MAQPRNDIVNGFDHPCIFGEAQPATESLRLLMTEDTCTKLHMSIGLFVLPTRSEAGQFAELCSA